MPQRTVTFDLGTDIGSLDELDVETAWNNWTDALALEGLRPADVPYRSTARSATYRAFSKDLEEEAQFFTLDFDIRKLSAYSAYVGALGLSAVLSSWHFFDAVQGLIA